MGNMDNCKMFTFDEYADYANKHGCFDEIDIELGYKYYIALFDEDPKAMAKADVNLVWNNLYRVESRFN
jgi:hypothetical protein